VATARRAQPNSHFHGAAGPKWRWSTCNGSAGGERSSIDPGPVPISASHCHLSAARRQAVLSPGWLRPGSPASPEAWRGPPLAWRR